MSVRVSISHDSADMASLREAWSALHQASAADSIFLTWEWVTTWWQYFGHDKTLWLLRATTDDGRLIGLGPMMVMTLSETNFTRCRILTFIGGGDAADHLDFIIERGWEAEVVPAFLHAIQAEPGWQALRIAQIPDYSPNLPFIEASGLPWEEDEPRITPYTPLPDDWETFAATLSPKSRENQRRFINKLNRTFPDEWEIGIVSDPDEVAPTLHCLITLHQAHWREREQPGSFATEPIISFHHRIAQLFFERGWLWLCSLRIKGQVTCAAYCFNFRGRACCFAQGSDFSLGNFHLGHVVVCHTVQCAVEQGLREYDFLWGNEEWKYKWNAVNRTDRTLTWYASTRALASHTLVKTATGTWRTVKDHLPDPIAEKIRTLIKKDH